MNWIITKEVYEIYCDIFELVSSIQFGYEFFFFYQYILGFIMEKFIRILNLWIIG